MEILNFLEECEKPPPPPELCFDIMELIGEQVNIIRKNKEYKKNYGECINTLKTVFREDTDNLFDCWDEWYREADWLLSFLADNNDDGVFVDRFYSP